MPACAELLRAKTGTFVGVLLGILARKAERAARRRCPTLKLRWRITVAVLLLCMPLVCPRVFMDQCGDVEKNPGPTEQAMEAFMDKIGRKLDESFDLLTKKMDGNQRIIEDRISKLHEDICVLRGEIEHNAREVGELQNDSNVSKQRLNELENEIDRLEAFNRKNNLKFVGVSESANVLDVLNKHSAETEWTQNDVESTHRVGSRKEAPTHPRPLIVRFTRWADKLAILRNKALRDGLRNDGIKVAGDLTRRQREQIEQARKEGKFAYFKNGRLHAEDRRTLSAGASQDVPGVSEGPSADGHQGHRPDVNATERDRPRQQQQQHSRNGGDNQGSGGGSVWRLPPPLQDNPAGASPRVPRESPPANRVSPLSARDPPRQSEVGACGGREGTGGGRHSRDTPRDMSQQRVSDMFQRTPVTRASAARGRGCGNGQSRR